MVNKKVVVFSIAIFVVGIIVLVTGIIFLLKGEKGLTVEEALAAAECGNGKCEINEDCNTCVFDCGCAVGEACTSIGICKPKEICGDSVCTDLERSAGSCCDDCGCTAEQVCNKMVHRCQDGSNLTEARAQSIAESYIASEGISGVITSVANKYYNDKIVKQVKIDCGGGDVDMVCEVVLYVDEFGEIVEVLHAA